MQPSLAVLVAVGRGASQLTGKAVEAIVRAIARAKYKHNNRLLTLGEFIAVTLQCNPAPRRRHSIDIAALARFCSLSQAVQSNSLYPSPPTNRFAYAKPALGDEGYESFR
jgi:hypothetical protein